MANLHPIIQTYFRQIEAGRRGSLFDHPDLGVFLGMFIDKLSSKECDLKKMGFKIFFEYELDEIKKQVDFRFEAEHWGITWVFHRRLKTKEQVRALWEKIEHLAGTGN